MNANKLADSAKKIHTTIEALEFVQKAILLLRQQQAEIEALKLRELTDEEIIATFNYFCVFKDESKSTIHNPKYFEEQMILYARLILETASRKANENEL